MYSYTMKVINNKQIVELLQVFERIIKICDLASKKNDYIYGWFLFKQTVSLLLDDHKVYLHVSHRYILKYTRYSDHVLLFYYLPKVTICLNA